MSMVSLSADDDSANKTPHTSDDGYLAAWSNGKVYARSLTLYLTIEL